jgi:methylthioribose-1-phosphate isomerase
MNAMKTWLGLLACAGMLAAGAPAQAQPAGAGAEAPAEATEDATDWASWIQQLEAEAKKLRELRKTEAALAQEVSRARSRRYPRGEERQRLFDAHERARKDLDETERHLGELTEQARQAGVPQGMLQDYEELAESPASAAGDADSDW